MRRLSIAALALALGACASVPAPEPVAEPAPAEPTYRDLLAAGWTWTETRGEHSVLVTLEPPR